LIEPLEREIAAPLPAFLDKKPEERSQAERIQFWIYQLRDLAAGQWSEPGSPEIFAGMRENPTPADRLCAVGPAAIPFLIEALEDSTPTRTTVHSRFILDSASLLRRQDIAFECLERIVGGCFYRNRMGFPLISDTPQRRESAIAHAKAWWGKSRGATQAQMIRNYLELMGQNVTLRNEDGLRYFDSERLQALCNLGMLEGPEGVIEAVRQIHEERFFDFPTVRERLDPKTPLSQQEITRCVAAIEGGDIFLRRKTVASLKPVPSYQIQRALLWALDHEPEAGERMAILRALGSSPKLWYLPALTKVFGQDPDGEARVMAGEIINTLVEDKASYDWWVRLETREAALEVARRLLREGKAPLELRRVAFDILRAWDSFVDRPLLGGLKTNPDYEFQEVRYRFKHLLEGERRDERIVPVLVKWLGYKDEGVVRNQAADGATRPPPPGAGSETSDWKALVGPAGVRENAAEALGLLGPRAAAAVPALVETLNDPSSQVCEQSAIALGKIGASAQPAVPLLIQILRSTGKDPNLRRASGEAVASIDAKGESLVPVLVEILRGRNDEGRWVAAGLLGKLGPLARKAVPTLLDSLDDDAPHIREAAAEALKRINP
jgi:HEAT repeat protein